MVRASRVGPRNNGEGQQGGTSEQWRGPGHAPGWDLGTMVRASRVGPRNNGEGQQGGTSEQW